MEGIYDLRAEADRDIIANQLPLLDGIAYTLTREEFLHTISDAVRFLPSSLPLTYRNGKIQVHATLAGILDLVELGGWLRRLEMCVGFHNGLIAGFGNPPQFWDSYFEARVAAFFKGAIGVEDLEFCPLVVARGRPKRPEFRVYSCVGEFLVECKRLHFLESQAMRKGTRDLSILDDAMTKAGWPKDYCLEVEFLGPEREQMPDLAAKIVNAALGLIGSGGGTFDLQNVVAHVRHHNSPFKIELGRAGVFQHVVRSPGHPVQIIDHRHTPLRVLHRDRSREYMRLLSAALSDARRQLPSTEDGVICIGDFPLRMIADLLDPRLPKMDLASHLKLLMLWERNEVEIYSQDNDRSFITGVFGKELTLSETKSSEP